MADMRLPFAVCPPTDNDASHYAKYGVGGYYSVPTEEDKTRIPAVRLEVGQLVYVIGTKKYWIYSEEGSWIEQDFVLKPELSSLEEQINGTIGELSNSIEESIQTLSETINTLSTWGEYE